MKTADQTKLQNKKIKKVVISDHFSSSVLNPTSEAISSNGISASQSSSDVLYPANNAKDGNVNNFTKTGKLTNTLAEYYWIHFKAIDTIGNYSK